MNPGPPKKLPATPRSVPVSPGRRRPPPPRRNPREILRFADRLGAELSALIACIPTAHLSASGMSRWLGINRGTCQRVLLATRAIGDPREILRKAPGVEGLDEFVRAMATRIGARHEIDRAHAMVQEYAELIHRGGGSLAKLVRLVDRDDPDEGAAGGGGHLLPGDSDLLAARKSIYLASRMTIGMWSAANVAVQVFRPSLTTPGSLDEVHARGYIGVRRRADGLALYSRLMGATDAESMTTLEGESGQGRQWSALLAEFCSEPLPTVISHREHNALAWIILGDSAVIQPVDVVLGGRSSGSHPDPRTDVVPHLSTMIGLRFPSQAQVLDLYLHRDLATGGSVQQAALARHPGDVDPVNSWYDKLAYKPSLRAMGPGLAADSPPAYPRMSELAAHIFSRARWSPDEFELWRLELAYPTPGMFYTLTLHPAQVSEAARAARPA